MLLQHHGMFKDPFTVYNYCNSFHVFNHMLRRAATQKLAALHTLDVNNVPLIDMQGHPVSFDRTCNYVGWIKKWSSKIPDYLDSEPENEM